MNDSDDGVLTPPPPARQSFVRRHRGSLIAVAAVLAAILLIVAFGENRRKAAAAAAAWLRYVDAADYAASYDTAAAVFRAAVAKSRWAEMAATVRSPLGAVVKRTLRSARMTKPLT